MLKKRVLAALKMALDKTSTTRAAGHQSVTDWGGQMGTYGPSMGVRRGFEGVQTVGRDPVLLLLSLNLAPPTSLLSSTSGLCNAAT